jgi:class 3 adenylate cyclase
MGGAASSQVRSFTDEMQTNDDAPSSRVAPTDSTDAGAADAVKNPLQRTMERMRRPATAWFKKRNMNTLELARAFVPWCLQAAYFEDKLGEKEIIIHRGQGAVIFSDASGFTALTEKLAKKSNGAELLSSCLTSFFTPLIDLINAYRGDVIKFSGDALTVYFPAVDDTKREGYNPVVPPHGTYGLPDIGPMATAVLRASACCIEIHRRLHMFDTGVGEGAQRVYLCLHIGVGCGDLTVLQVGGAVPPETHVPRFEYVISGHPIEQISIAEPLAKNGETCLSPQAWEYIKDCAIEGQQLEERPDFHILTRIDECKYTFPTIKYAARTADMRELKQFGLSELNVLRRYIPSNVFKQIEGGTLHYVNEMRNITTIFISGSGVDVSTDKGAEKAQDLVESIQKSLYAHEGTLNKFVIDDKGMLFVLVWGLPPLVHTDDASRATLCCFDMIKIFKRLNLVGRFGVTTGRNFCGQCGSMKRMEYTVLGDTVNLSARLMANAPPNGILTDEETKNLSNKEINFEALMPIKVKGKANPIPIYSPTLDETRKVTGIVDGKICFPWYVRSLGAGALQVGATDGETKYQRDVQLICGLTDWPAIQRLTRILGEPFSEEIHSARNQLIPKGAVSRGSAPQGSIFRDGGVMVLVGPTGLGKLELAHHTVTHACFKLASYPSSAPWAPGPGT